ncbi:hypothetical protein AJ80_09092 [Polytolypa hystricis UAMH7299]|uniref:Glucose-methanol-choline oxidoreductase N-terminal domain-containing protein n=1 Tax=Polytolypa hystricis (strain UAMH7299) TaxID=1447883 RepID=A0A2B7WWG5_POLH7|nr:hypothetical protein AJ80_09092 [Polytolypa hystricis UAMH7299]
MGGIFNQLPSGLDEVDVIIAGGGTAGCVVAARLSDADPKLSILVIEGGQNNYNDPSIIYPVLFLSHLMPTSKTTLFYQGSKESALADRELVVPSGGVLGGGSSINLMTYSRAQRSDYDSWQAPGWSAKELGPYLRKLETYHGPGAADTHGDAGPVHISAGTYVVDRSQGDFIQSAARLGWPEVKDLQNFETNNATQRNLRFIGLDGKRQDAAHRYLHPRLQDGNHSNLYVLVENQVVRVLFENKKAVGVEYQPNPNFHNDIAVRSIKAKKMVIVCCGALGSPLVLERSGIGDPSILERAGVGVVADVPGVGWNYIDHHLLAYPYRSSLRLDETVDAIYGQRIDVGSLIQSNASILGWNAADVTSKLRPSETDIAALGPAFQEAWNRDYKDNPNKPLAIMTSLNGFPGDPTGLPVAQFMSVSTFTVYPYSRGHIHITGPGVSDAIDFKTGFFSDENGIDVKKSMWAYKKQREIFRRMDIYRGEYPPGHPPFHTSSNAACIETDIPLRDVQDIVYSSEDDAILEQWLRQNVGSTWHSMGTCKMAPREELGVVDLSLSVYGVKDLKVVDLSIPPQNIAANTANTAFVVGEKAADIIIEELGLGRK